MRPERAWFFSTAALFALSSLGAPDTFSVYLTKFAASVLLFIALRMKD